MKRPVLYLVMIAATVAYAAVCAHSVQEIHYLKSFFPKVFSVEEAFYAAAVELIKVVIIGLPVLLLMGLCALLAKKDR